MISSGIGGKEGKDEMGKERQRGALIVQAKVKWKDEGFRDAFRCRLGQSFVGGLLNYLSGVI